MILVCRPGLGAFFLKNNIVDEIFELDKKDAKSVRGFLNFMSAKPIRYLFCAHRSFRSAWILRDTRAQKKISYKNWWNKFFFDDFVERPMNLPEALRVLSLLEPVDEQIKKEMRELKTNEVYFNLKTKTQVERWPGLISDQFSLYIEPQIARVRELSGRLRLQRPYAVVAPSSQWPTKRWTDSGLVGLIRLLNARGLHVYLVGTPKEAEHCRVIERSSQTVEKTGGAAPAQYEVRSLAGQTDILELHELLSGSEVVVANDSGPMHMAAAAGRPVVGIFGPTTLELGYRPWSNLSAIVQVDLPCRPCGKHGHTHCPIGTHDCMKKITASDVIVSVDRLLDKAQSVSE